MSSSSNPAKPRLLLKRLLIVTSSLVVGLGLAEGIARIVLREQGNPYDGQTSLIELERAADTIKAFTPPSNKRPEELPADRVLHPFFGSETGSDPGNVIAHFSRTPPEQAFEVLVVGGSVAMLFGRDASKSLEDALEAIPEFAGRQVHVLNGAHAAYKQPQQLNKVGYLFAHGFRPDLVLNLDGFNEVANGLHNALTGTNPLFPTPPVWAGLFLGRNPADTQRYELSKIFSELGERYKSTLASARKLGLMHSAITGTWIRRKLNRIRNERSSLQIQMVQLLDPKAKSARSHKNRELVGDPYERNEMSAMNASVVNWVECSISLNAICEAREIAYIHALQPTLWDPGAKPIVGGEAKVQGARHWRRGVELGYPRLRAAIPELEAAGVSVLDLSMVFAEVHDELYFDPCHYGPEGSLKLVGPMVAKIQEHLAD